MPQLVLSRRKFAGIPVTMTTATASLAAPGPSRRVVALGWISRSGGQVTISDRLADSTASTGR